MNIKARLASLALAAAVAASATVSPQPLAARPAATDDHVPWL